MRFLVAVLILLPSLVCAQLNDDFTDGDFTANPAWTGDTALFNVNGSQQLQLDDIAAGQAQLRTDFSVGTLNNLEWSFYIRQSFSPSGNNNSRVYLVSDQADLSGSLNGYYLQFGEAGSNDAIELFYQNGTTSTSVARSSDGIVASSFTYTVKVTRDDNATWQILYDPNAGTNYQLEASAIDNNFNGSAFFGVICNYTSSNASNFYYDDFLIAPMVQDTVAPQLQNITVIDSNSIDVEFNEALLAGPAQNVLNYAANNGLGNPSSAMLDGSDPSLVHLDFANTFTDGLSNNITISNLEDLNGNILIAVNTNFTYNAPVNASFRDIVINEILADPSPPIGLPDAEFIELYNRSGQAIDLDDWTLSDASSTATLSSFVLNDDDFVLLCSNSDTALFSIFSNVLGVSSFPSLNNSGDFLTLSDEVGTIIDTVRYDLSWYQDPVKENGGYTLELINPNYGSVCPQAAYWIGSFAAAAGTPGHPNSILDTLPDNTPPSVISATAINNTTIQLCFDEAIVGGLLQNAFNYSVDQGIGVPNNASPTNNNTCVELSLLNPLTDNTTYLVSFFSLTDCAGNPTTVDTISFTFIQPEDADPYDIIINEIMADPAPPVALPDAEFVELYNRSNKNIDLTGWGITDGGTVAVIGNELLLAGEYIIVCKATDTALFSLFGKVTGTASFPSLNNSGDDVLLYENSGDLIDAVSYDDSWYQDPGKDEGGFTLERIDPDFVCPASRNWRGSNDLSGGTPGRLNSVDGTYSDNEAPGLIRASVLNSSRITLHFSEVMDSLLLVDVGSYSIDQGIGTPTNAVMQQDDFRNVILSLGTPITAGTIYTVTVNANFSDCAGNLLPFNSTARFALAQPAQPGDLIINEILFNPISGGSDFVELYNLSTHTIELKNVRIANADLTTGVLDQVVPASDESFLLFPDEYVALSENIQHLKDQYHTPFPGALLEISDLPTYNDEEGICVILDPALTELERYRYHEDDHFALLDDEDGVSMERIRFTDALAWHSAAGSAGFATPGYRNSQYSETESSSADFDVDPEVFSPDNDGHEDVLNINYSFDKPGFIATVNIFDSRGRLKRELVNNESLSTSGTIIWDGTTDDREKARTGIYVVFVEVFHADGETSNFKLPCVVATRF